ncbi:AsnC family transcriptional regulator [candidate division LCP-89 bacterium B3_LCP]|uniref:AsnC family transcriptional regulator n=1 Tax=candidate division LCP-89 bacterium B3_LCP TaxID=2012998 RepID=A0A532UYR3_UNCL8|nr:MAG: AsnC family transcriptional regulator [candidate division LCP-89 bacterium B3_LCP]
MKAQAHILISVTVGKARQVYEKMRDIPEITSVDAISGPYDIIAKVEAYDFSIIGTVVLDKIQAIEGVVDTITCHVVPLEN